MAALLFMFCGLFEHAARFGRSRKLGPCFVLKWSSSSARQDEAGYSYATVTPIKIQNPRAEHLRSNIPSPEYRAKARIDVMQPTPSEITKTYPPRGPLQQYRFADSTAFDCFRCGEAKKSKLITVYGGNWSKRLCNGCYGRLLSLYEIKAGTQAEDERAEALSDTLLAMAATDDVRQAERLFRAADQRAERLSAETMRFIATSEFVAGQLDAAPQLEWSPAVIGLCKALELELISRVLKPLAALTVNSDLTADKKDKDIGRIAAYCAEPARKPPELGSFSHFLQTVIHSTQRRENSALVRVFLKLAADWPGALWLLQPDGLHSALTSLTTNFRNPAAHIDELGKQHYVDCRNQVIGSDGALWKLIVATERR